MKRLVSTVSNAKPCHWCGRTDNLRPVKVSPKRSKGACSMCFELFKPIKPELPIDKDRGFSQFFWRVWLKRA